MTSNRLTILGFILAGLGFLMINSAYILDQREFDIVIQLGDIVRADKDPGLKFKIPFIQNTVFFDNRIQTIVFTAGDDSEVVSSDQKTMKLNAFSKFRISDPLKFFVTVRDEKTLRARMIALVESSVREVVGSTKFADVLGANRIVVMERITNMVMEQMIKFGIEVLEVRITRIALPEKALAAVYARMRTDREKEANEIRATGSEEGQKIRADAEKQKAVMLASAKKESQTLIGEAEAVAIKTIADAVGKDIEFFDFYRSMDAYKNAFGKSDTKIVIGTEHPFLKYFESTQ